MEADKAKRVEALRETIDRMENGSTASFSIRSKGHLLQQVDSASHDTDDGSGLDAFKRIARLVSFRERSCKELKQRLISEGFQDVAVEAALTRAKSCGLVDDARFADTLIRSRLVAGRGKEGIEAELASADIDFSLLPGWPSVYFDEDISELDRALEYLRRHPPHSKNRREGAYRMLVRKGYGSSVASQASRTWCEEHL